MDSVAKDLRYALRSLARHKALTAVAVACMGLGIGVCATLFTAVNPWLFRSLPYPDSRRLVGLRETEPLPGAQREGWTLLSGPNYLDWQSGNRSFESIGAFERTQFNLSTDDEPERTMAARVTASLFPTLRVGPVYGRGFTEEEERPGSRVAMIGHQLWQRRFAGDAGVLGGTLRLDGALHTIVGVMPPDFAFPEYAEVWTPLGLDGKEADRGSRRLDAVARLTDGVTPEQAQAELEAIAAGLAGEHPETNRGRGARVRPLLDLLTPPGVVLGLKLILIAGLFVQLIACANVANLLLAKAVAQRHETALRIALGAGRGRLFRQFLIETLLLASAGAMLGLLAARWGVALLMGGTPVRPPFWAVMDLDFRAVGFVTALTAASALLVGLAPLWQTRRLSVLENLKEGSRALAGGTRGRLGRWLVVSELAAALVLLIGAALMVQSFASRQRIDPGYEPRGVLTARLALAGEAYADAGRRAAFLDELVRRLRALPETEGAGVASGLLFTEPPPYPGRWSSRTIEVEGRPLEPERAPRAVYHVASTGYLEAVGIRVRQGRLFSPEEEAAGARVAVISDDLASRHWGEQPVGRRLRLGGGPWLEIVGVVERTREGGDMLLIGSKPPSQIYVPYRQDPLSTVTVAIRGRSDPALLAGPLHDALRALDPGLPLSAVFTLEEARARSSWVAAMWGRMMSQVAGLALLLAALGAYGVVSHQGSQRTHEIGIRMAVGAGRGDVVRLVVGQGLGLALRAAAAGTLAALALTRALASLLHGIAPHDPGTFAACAGGLVLAALTASFAPALRAARVDPATALRFE